MFNLLSRLQEMPSAEVVTAAQTLSEKYPEDLESDLSMEPTQFAQFVKINSARRDKLEDSHGGKVGVKANGELSMYLLLYKMQLTQTFPNVEIMLLSMMVSNCSGERTFSKLGIIKN